MEEEAPIHHVHKRRVRYSFTHRLIMQPSDDPNIYITLSTCLGITGIVCKVKLNFAGSFLLLSGGQPPFPSP